MSAKYIFPLHVALLAIVLSGCTLDPNWVNRDPNMTTFTMCGIPEGQDRLFGVRYIYWVPDIFFQPHCNHSRLQYYKREDHAWIHGGIRGTELRIEGNLEGDHDHYNMDINKIYEWLLLLSQGNRKWRESRGERFSYSLDRVQKNDMTCIRLETLLREYRAFPKPNKDYSNCPAYRYNVETGRSSGEIPRHISDECKAIMSQRVVRQLAVKNIEYYCWAPNDNLNHYVKIGAKTLSGFAIPDEKFDRYYSHIKKINIIPEEEDEYANAPLDYSVDLEKEVLDPVFASLTIRPVSDEVKQRLDAQWKSACESKMKAFELGDMGKDSVWYRRMYLENCGYTLNWRL